MSESSLLTHLRDVFGHAAFRPSQEEVCRAIAEGKDALVVMPTGAGKSLCYQLPGLARGGTTLVVSPLLSLIEDQVSKLRALGVRAERIHSGLSREDSRAVCRRYLDGELQFLFVAPERLAVPGFPEMLAKRRLALVAIDEAHCISQWGHDFRPEYRMLGARLPLFRPSPIVALTATATPDVQDDISRQLGIEERFIRGFRRDNLGIEVLALSPGRRGGAIASLLEKEERLPAIVYTNARKDTESLAAELSSRLRARAYHAGLPNEERDRVQRAFSDGSLDVVVATVAFGMGIDKSNIRTVIHAGLPASVEGFYQEIGRAGRDGKLAHAVLFYSYIDKRTHEFLLGRSYPEMDVLEGIYKRVKKEPRTRDDLRDRMKVDDETFERAIDQLWVHGAITFGEDDFVLPTGKDFTKTYGAQRSARFQQLDKMIRFAESPGCRMNALVHHFGDGKDDDPPCGLCDSCHDGGCIARSFREASPGETAIAARLVRFLGEKSRSTGQILTEFGDVPRDMTMHLLDALVRSGSARADAASFVKDGERISFTRYRLEDSAFEEGSPLRISLGEEPSKRKRKRDAARVRPTFQADGANDHSSSGGQDLDSSDDGSSSVRRRSSEEAPTPLHAALREWRRITAKEAQVPAFRIFSNRVLDETAEQRPIDLAALMACRGVGNAVIKKYGRPILSVVEAHSGAGSRAAS